METSDERGSIDARVPTNYTGNRAIFLNSAASYLPDLQKLISLRSAHE
jgi:hypothetical protein